MLTVLLERAAVCGFFVRIGFDLDPNYAYKASRIRSQSPLFALPKELRMCIYEHVFDDTQVTIMGRDDHFSSVARR
jgi:hypothetical protein